MSHLSQFPDPVVDQLGVNVVMKKEMNITHLIGIFNNLLKLLFLFILVITIEYFNSLITVMPNEDNL